MEARARRLSPLFVCPEHDIASGADGASTNEKGEG